MIQAVRQTSSADGVSWDLGDLYRGVDDPQIGRDLETALWRTEAAHIEHQKRAGSSQDENWPAWYASYMVAEQAGSDLPA